MNCLDDEKLNEILIIFSSKLSLLSNNGIMLLEYLSQADPIKTEYVPAVLSLRHVMEMLAGISVLIRNKLADPALLLLRGLFESVVQTLFILDKDTENRGMSFMYFDLLKHIDWHEKLDTESQKGKELVAWIKKDTYLNSTKFDKPPNFDEKLSDLIDQKTNSEYSKVHYEYEKQKLNGKKVKNWFSLFGGPKSIEQVAAEVGIGGTYQIFYRHLSEAVHGVGIVRGKIMAEGGKGAIKNVRALDNIQYVVSTSISISFLLLNKIIEVMCPEKNQEFIEFYKREIREVYLRVSENNYLGIEKRAECLPDRP